MGTARSQLFDGSAPNRVTEVTKFGSVRSSGLAPVVPQSPQTTAGRGLGALGAYLVALAQGMLQIEVGVPITGREPEDEALATTLLELVQIVSKYCRTDDEVVAVVRHLVNTKRVRLTGNFRGRVFA